MGKIEMDYFGMMITRCYSILPTSNRTQTSMLKGCLTGLVGWLLLASAHAQTDHPSRLPGLIAHYELSNGQSFDQISFRFQQSWKNPSELDERLRNTDTTQITWRGLLDCKTAGQYTLHVFQQGQCSLWLDGAQVIKGDSENPQWHVSQSLELSLGLHELKCTYANRQPAGMLGLYWQGPGFELEPLSEKVLLHRTSETVSDTFERGRLLTYALRCTACHTSNDLPQPLTAPPLTTVNDSLEAEWLVNWLIAQPPTPAANVEQLGELIHDQVERRMPHFALSPQDARDMAAALRLHSVPLDRDPLAAAQRPAKSSSASKSSKNKDSKPPRTTPDAAAGRVVFQTSGCLACHTLHRQGITLVDPEDDMAYLPHHRFDKLAQSLFNGGDLSDIGDKRTPETLALWLLDPRHIHANSRMPQPDLTNLQREDLVLYLTSLRSTQPSDRAASKQNGSSATANPTRGMELISQHRCGACHELPDKFTKPTVRTAPLTASSKWGSGCMNPSAEQSTLPRFDLTAAQRQAMRDYWSQLRLPQNQSNEPPSYAKLQPDVLIAQLNCTTCHARNALAGLAPRVNRLAAEFSDLAPQLPALIPPSLTGVGDKFHAPALRQAILRRGQPRRPWLEIRMPKYALADEQAAAVVQHLIDADRIPTTAQPPNRLPDDVVTRSAAARLVTAEGFGCQSCHQIGKQAPPAVALNARGTDLTMLGDHIRHEWFNRWVRNPVRMIPRMEMPAIQTPVHGVLNDDLKRQIDAVWEMLNTPGFQPPTPAPVRIVRGTNRPGVIESANVLTDVLESPSQNYLRPLIIGLGNRHNLLFDLETAEVAQWWLGDTARELTRGKSWYWELGGQPLVSKGSSLLKWKLLDSSGKRLAPLAREQFATELDGVRHTQSGIQWSGRITFGSMESPVSVPVEFHIEPLKSSSQTITGIDCQLTARIPADFVLVAELDEASEGFQPSASATDHKVWTFAIDQQSMLRIQANTGWESLSPHAVAGGKRAPGQATDLRWTLETKWPVDQWFEPSASSLRATNTSAALPLDGASLSPEPLSVVPGFDGVKLPLPRNEMPVGLTWHHGQLIAASLKGKVLRAEDTNGDRLVDTWRAISDDFPAPYGVASQGQAIDVLTKVGLLRLSEPANDTGLPWSWQTVADGWGYTADYHDWAVGLPQDSQGNYYVALPCQQDDRSVSSARLRGTIQKLIPQTATSDNPRAFRLETFAAGQRFPMGLAFNLQGDLFATDNQGNYNPFNELNHLQVGKRYGFINKLENRDGFRPELESPAVNLPHPWTRSVNGICFLQTPKTAPSSAAFGPYEGHLIGCEYNGLSLIRMSLEVVDGVYQGAAYLFSRPPADGETTFEGPVVCAVSPDGQLYVGNIHDSGWGGGQNTGSIVRLTPNGTWPLGIATVTALSDGLRVAFTGAIDSAAASNPANYTIRSYRRISTPAYGGSDQDEREEPVLRAIVAADKPYVDLKLKPLRAGYVYEVRVGAVAGAQTLFPSEAHYTMKKLKP